MEGNFDFLDDMDNVEPCESNDYCNNSHHSSTKSNSSAPEMKQRNDSKGEMKQYVMID